MNPARQLADLLESWTAAGNPTTYSRRGGSSHDLSMWHAVQGAMVLLAQVLITLDNLDRMGHDTSGWRIHEAEWFRSIVQPDRDWSRNTTGALVDPSAVGALRNLGTMLDVLGTAAPVAEEQIARVSDALDEAIALASDTTISLSGAERAYVLTLAQELRDVVERKIVLGEVDLRARVDQLNGALMRIAGGLSEEGDSTTAKRFVDVASKILAATRGVIHDVATIAAAATAIVAITSGHA